MNKSDRITKAEKERLEKILAQRALDRGPQKTLVVADAMLRAIRRAEESRDVGKLKNPAGIYGAD